MRARLPDVSGHVVRDGVSLGYEMFGEGDRTILLLPTWTIIHSRSWKMQVPYLARHYRVITYDGPGNGRSDRVTDPARYTPESHARDAATVMDECEVDSAVAVGLSRGGVYALALARHFPHRVDGLVLVGPALGLGPPLPERARIAANFRAPYPPRPQGWDRYNLAYWYDHYEDFARFFFSQVFSEPHSTKQIQDTVEWALETTPAVLEAEAGIPRESAEELLADVRAPLLVIHGSEDRIISHQVGGEAARLGGGELLTLEGSGHAPLARDPVKVNLAIREFIERRVR